MTCTACGEHPKKNTAKDFTKAVIEINNPETLVLFRKVVIPTSMGDETQVPAAVGKYYNVLLVYEANNHVYLYSSDGIPTLISSGVAPEAETIENYTIATSSWAELSDSSPYTHQASVTATYTIGDNTVVKLLNDDPVTFANYGFAVGSVSGQTIVLYSIGQPSADVTLNINYRG